MDSDSIPLGSHFPTVIRQAILFCDVFVLIIGPNWMTGEADGRLHVEDDPVRVELEQAVRFEKLIVPILINGTQMPSESELPPSLVEITKRHGLRVRDELFHHDLTPLLQRVEEVAAAKYGFVVEVCDDASSEDLKVHSSLGGLSGILGSTFQASRRLRRFGRRI